MHRAFLNYNGTVRHLFPLWLIPYCLHRWWHYRVPSLVSQIHYRRCQLSSTFSLRPWFSAYNLLQRCSWRETSTNKIRVINELYILGEGICDGDIENTLPLYLASPAYILCFFTMLVSSSCYGFSSGCLIVMSSCDGVSEEIWSQYQAWASQSFICLYDVQILSVCDKHTTVSSFSSLKASYYLWYTRTTCSLLALSKKHVT